MRKNTFSRIIAFALSLLLTLTLVQPLALAEYTANGISTLDEWNAVTYADAPNVAFTPLSMSASQQYYTGLTGGQFLAPIEAPAAGSIPISNRAQLESIRNNLSGTYHLTADIDLSGAEWVPIGIDDTAPFTGVFDGQGYVIRNLTITGNRRYSGLFGVVSGSTIKNVGIEDAYVDVTLDSSNIFAGGICGYVISFPNTTTIYNCYNTGTVIVYCSSPSFSAANAGGICGGANSASSSPTIISSCYNLGYVNASSIYTAAHSGGISGFSYYASISNCYNTGAVSAFSAPTNSGHAANAGGISGSASPSVISYCFNTGDISASITNTLTNPIYANAGGICGYTSESINDSYNTGKVTVHKNDFLGNYGNAGGVCGSIGSYASIDRCYNSGIVSVNSGGNSTLDAGGICGNSNNSAVFNYCYWENSSALTGIGRVTGSGTDATISLTTAQMKDRDNITVNYAGFDFTNDWGFIDGENDGYPVLHAFYNDVDVPPSNNYVTTSVTTFAELQDAVSAYDSADDDMTILIDTDFDLLANITIPANPNGKALTITSDGIKRKLSRGFMDTSDNSTGLFMMENGSRLILENIIIDGAKGTHAANYAASIVYVNDTAALFELRNGAVLQNHRGLYGSSDGSSSTVFVRSGVFNMSGGEIRDNESGGVDIAGYGSFNMSGGTISGNIGSGVSVRGSNPFNMTGGTIRGNTSTSGLGYGVFINTGCKLNLGASPIISDGVYTNSLLSASIFIIDDLNQDSYIVIEGSRGYNSGTEINQMQAGVAVATYSGPGSLSTVMAQAFVSKYGSLVGVANGNNVIWERLSIGSTVEVSTFPQFLSAIEAYGSAADDMTINIDTDFAFTSKVSIPENPSGKTLTITCNNSTHTLTRHIPTRDSGINVYSGAKLILENIIIDGNKGASIDDILTSLIWIRGELILGNGAVVQNHHGSGVYVDYGGVFTMNGGKISENDLRDTTGRDVAGGGVYVGGGGTFTMNSGEITGNVAVIGGGVYVGNDGTFTMNSGEISGNVAVSGNVVVSGGGVCVFSSGTFIMNGGVIKENMANVGGGVYSEGTFIMNDTGIIKNNTAYMVDYWFGGNIGDGGGVRINRAGYSDSTFTMFGGEISGNTPDGVYMMPNPSSYLTTTTTFNMHGGIVSGNIGNGVTAVFGSVFNMSGGEITGNTIRGLMSRGATINFSGKPTINDGVGVLGLLSSDIFVTDELLEGAHIVVEGSLDSSGNQMPEGVTVGVTVATYNGSGNLTEAMAQTFVSKDDTLIGTAVGDNVVWAANPNPVIIITTQPTATTIVTQGGISGSLVVSANVTQGAVLNYQWYSNTTANNTGGTAISGETSASFTIPTNLTAIGSPYYYYCVLSVAGDSVSKPSDVATIIVNIHAPTASPGSGAVLMGTQVTLMSAATEAVIRYTLDNAEPDEDSDIYTDPIEINKATTIKAKAYVSGIQESDTVTFIYEVKVNVPTTNQPPGFLSRGTYISLSSLISDAEIRYTTNGSEPTESSNLYSAPIQINELTRIRARAYKSGFVASDLVAFSYDIMLELAAPIADIPTGYVANSTTLVRLSNETSGTTIRYTTDGSEPNESSAVYQSPILISSPITIKAKAFRNNWVTSDTATFEYFFKPVAPLAHPNTSSIVVGSTVILYSTTPNTTIRYTTDGNDPTESSSSYAAPIPISETTTIKAKAFRPGWDASDTATFEFTAKATTPTANLASGLVPNGSTITLSSDIVGAIVRYSIDGSEPTVNSPIYLSPIVVNAATTVKARTFKSDLDDSDTAIFTYTVEIETPTIAPNYYYVALDDYITISCETPGVIIYYTTDNTEPSENSSEYTSPILIRDIDGVNSVNSPFIIKAKAYRSDMMPGRTTMSEYQTAQRVAAPTANHASGSALHMFGDSKNNVITLECETEGAIIRYTTNGLDPDENSAYGGVEINIGRPMSIKAKAFKNGMVPSETVELTYTIAPYMTFLSFPGKINGVFPSYVGTFRNLPVELDLNGIPATVFFDNSEKVIVVIGVPIDSHGNPTSYWGENESDEVIQKKYENLKKTMELPYDYDNLYSSPKHMHGLPFTNKWTKLSSEAGIDPRKGENFRQAYHSIAQNLPFLPFFQGASHQFLVAGYVEGVMTEQGFKTLESSLLLDYSTGHINRGVAPDTVNLVLSGIGFAMGLAVPGFSLIIPKFGERIEVNERIYYSGGINLSRSMQTILTENAKEATMSYKREDFIRIAFGAGYNDTINETLIGKGDWNPHSYRIDFEYNYSNMASALFGLMTRSYTPDYYAFPLSRSFSNVPVPLRNSTTSILMSEIHEQSVPYNLSNTSRALNNAYTLSQPPQLNEPATAFVSQTASTSISDFKSIPSYIYDQTAPLVAEVDNTRVMLFIADDDSKSGMNSSTLMYSIYNEANSSWSVPQAVHDDGTADFYPNIASDGDSLWVTWHKSKTALTDTMIPSGATEEVQREMFYEKLDELLSSAEIAVARFDSGSNRFTDIEILTDNNILDTHPKIAVNGNEAFAVWIQNENNDIFGATDYDNKIIAREYSNGSWGLEIDLTTASLGIVTDMAAGYLGGNALVAFITDNNDLETLDDRSLIVMDLNRNIINTPASDTLVSNPQFTKINGSDVLCWYEITEISINEVTYYGGNIRYLTILDGQAQSLFAKPNLFTDYFKIMSNGVGDIAVVYPEFQDGIGCIYARLYKAGEWSNPFILAQTDGIIRHFDGILNDSGEFDFVTNSSERVTIGEGDNAELIVTNKLCSLKTEPSVNIRIMSVYYNDDDLRLGQQLPISVNVANLGGVLVNSIAVSVNNTNIGTFAIDGGLQIGNEATIEFYMDIPSSMNEQTIFTITIEPQALIDSDMDDNSVWIVLGHSNLSLSLESQYNEDGARAITATIDNLSDYAANATLLVHRGTLDGEVINAIDIGEIAGRDRKQNEFIFDPKQVVPEGEEYEVIYFQIISSNEELYTVNKSDFAVIFALHDPDVMQTVYALMVSASTGGTISDVSGTYAEGSSISITATPESGYSFAGWVSSNGGTFANADSASTTFTMPGNATTVTANFTYTGGDTNGSGNGNNGESPAQTTPQVPEPKDSEDADTHNTITKAPSTESGFTATITKSRTYTDGTFTDVAPGAWYVEAIRFVYEYGIMNGVGAATFSPNTNTTRAQIITILARLSGLDTDGGETWYGKAVEWAMHNGISDGTNLYDNVTREQLVTMLWRFAGEPQADATIEFTDAGTVSYWAIDAMKWAVSIGLIEGYTDGSVRPRATATRAEVATMIRRYMLN